MRRASLTFAMILSFAASGAAFSAEPLTTSIVDRHVIPGYRDFAEATAALRQKTKAWCDGQADRAAVDAKFAEAFTAWARIQHIDIGPVRYFDRRFRIQFWPDPRGVTGRAVADAIGENVEIGSASVALQGFPALERVLYQDDQPIDEICPLANAISGNLAVMAEETLAGWTEGFRAAFLDRKPDAMFPDDTEALTALMTGVMAGLQAVAEIQLGRPLGKSPERARPKLVEAWRSGLSLNLIRARLAASEDVYLLDGNGLDQALRDAGHIDLADLMVRAFSTTIARADSVRDPLSTAIPDPQARPILEQLVIEATALRAILAQSVAPALGVPPGFNSLDGD